MQYLALIFTLVLILSGCASLDTSEQVQNQTPAQAATAPESNSSIGKVSFRTPASVGPLPVPNNTSISGAWVSQGPSRIRAPSTAETANDGASEYVGALHTILAHPTNADIVWVAGVNSGIWKTQNATATAPNWVPLTDDQASLSIGAMDLDPTDTSSDTIVAGFGRYSSFAQEGGLLNGAIRTTDGGSTWTHLTDSLLDSESVSGVAARGATIVLSAHNQDSAFGQGGLFRSTDTGATWTKIDGGSAGLPTTSILDMVGDPNTSNRLYVTTINDGVYRSDDTGATWTRISTTEQNNIFALPGVNNAEMSVASNGRLYVAILERGQPVSIMFTDNPGDATPTWTAMDIPTVPGQDDAGVSITDASNESPIVITTSSAHGLKDFVYVSGVNGNTAANGVYSVTVTSDTTFSLKFTTGNGNYTGGGTALKVNGMNPRIKPGGQGNIHFSILADKDNPNILYVGGDAEPGGFVDTIEFTGNLWRGDTTVAPTGESPSPQWAHMMGSNSISAIPTGGTASRTAPTRIREKWCRMPTAMFCKLMTAA